MAQVRGRIALVTGGQRGLGAAITQELLDRGAAKVYVTSRTPVGVDDPRLTPLPLDVTDPDSVADLARSASDASIVVNNAGALERDSLSLLDGPMESVVRTFETNVFGALRVARAFAPILRADGSGVLVDMLSVMSWIGGFGAYGASKAALWSITNSLRLELANDGVTVMGVHLSFADTEMTRAVAGEKVAPADVAAAVVDGIENGDDEVLVDESTRRIKARLSGPVDGLIIGR